MCPAAAGGGGIGQKPRFLRDATLGRAGARIQRYQLVPEGMPERDGVITIRPRRDHVDRDVYQ